MEFYTRTEVSKLLRVTPKTIDRWLKKGILKGYKLGSGKTSIWRVAHSEIDRFLQEHLNTKNL